MFKLPMRSGSEPASESSVDAFLGAVRRTPAKPTKSGHSRLVFALDATMSRQPTWDLASGLQGQMFETAESLGGLDIQLVYFRGFSECRASAFLSNGSGLAKAMQRITVSAGRTQLGRVLTHVRDESRRSRVAAMIFVGDAIEEQPRDLLGVAGELALLGTKAFMFQEGRDRAAAAVFKEVATVTGGAYAPFDSRAPASLASLLAAAAAYSAGGSSALARFAATASTPEVVALLAQIR